MIYCFLDTNILIECQIFDQIDWKTAIDWPNGLSIEEIVLVIPFTVIHELDNIKGDARYGRKRKRARILLPKLEALWSEDKSSIRPNIFVKLLPRPDLQKLTALGYYSSLNDDLIVGQADLFRRENPDIEVAVIAFDTTVRLKAKQVGITAIAPSDKILLADDKDDNERELDEMRLEIARYQNLQPKLEIGFFDQGELINTIEYKVDFDQPLLTKEEIDTAVAELAKTLGYKPDFIDSTITAEIVLEGKKSSLAAEIGKMREMEHSYQSELGVYLENHKLYLQQVHAHKISLQRSKQLYVAIDNIGTAPAEDIDVSLHFPNGSDLWDKLPRFPEAPNPPVTPRQKLLGTSILSPIFYRPPTSNQNLPLPPKPNIRRTNSFTVTFHFDNLKHHMRWRWPEMWISFSKPNSLPTAFEVEYNILVGNKRDPHKGKLVIKLLA